MRVHTGCLRRGGGLLPGAPVLAVLILAVLGCNGTTEPGGVQIQFIAVPVVGGGFVLTLQGKNYTSPSLQTIRLDPGTHQATGTVHGTLDQGAQLAVGFTGGGSAVGRGGVEANSIMSLEGPVAVTGACGILYNTADPGPYQVRFRFSVTADPARAC